MLENILLNILFVVLTMYIVSTFLSAFFQTKQSTLTGKLVWVVYFGFQYCVMVTDADRPLLVLVMNIVMVFLLCRSNYLTNPKTAFFFLCIIYTVWMAAEVLTAVFLQLIGISDDNFFVAGNIISKLILCMAAYIVKHYRRNNLFGDLPFLTWIKLLLVPLATIFIFIMDFSYYHMSVDGNRIFFIVIIILLLLINYLALDVFEKLTEKIETDKRNLIYEQQIALCNTQAAEREEAYQETRRVRHDLNDYLIDLLVTLQEGRVSEAENKIETLLERNKIYKNEISRSGNLSIDALINYKYALACKEAVDMQCHVFIPDEVPYDSTDLCIILGNLLDNALEAVMHLQEKLRWVEVNVTQIKGSLSITVRNPFEGEISKDRFGGFLTGKTDKINHGLGLESVRRSVEKYDGELQTDAADGLFCVTVLLYPGDKASER